MPRIPQRPEDGLEFARGLFLFILVIVIVQAILVRATAEHPVGMLLAFVIGFLLLLAFLASGDDDGRGQGGTDRRTGERTPLWPTD
jgi:hypothetical protein